MSKTDGLDYQALAQKGGGVLTRHASGVWTYPGVALDPSGTNLRLPLEYVPDAAVQEAIGAGKLVAITRSVANEVLSVRVTEGEAPVVLSTAQAGTAEAGTELPITSRPSHDAGATKVTPEEAAAQVAANLYSLQHPAPPPAPEPTPAAPKAPTGQKPVR